MSGGEEVESRGERGYWLVDWRDNGNGGDVCSEAVSRQVLRVRATELCLVG